MTVCACVWLWVCIHTHTNMCVRVCVCLCVHTHGCGCLSSHWLYLTAEESEPLFNFTVQVLGVCLGGRGGGLPFSQSLSPPPLNFYLSHSSLLLLPQTSCKAYSNRRKWVGDKPRRQGLSVRVANAEPSKSFTKEGQKQQVWLKELLSAVPATF